VKNIAYDYYRKNMASVSVDTRTILMVVVVAVVILGGAYLLNPSYTRRLLGGSEGFTDAVDAPTLSDAANYKMNEAAMDVAGKMQEEKEKQNPNVAPTPDAATATAGKAEGYADLSDFEGPSNFGNAEPPAGCYPRDQLTPSELLPKDPNSIWAQQNPMGTGSLKGKNFLSAGALIGVNTVGQSLRNANYQLRSEPPNPQVPISVFNQTTIEPDVNRRTLEIA
jgi:hypothetical protein